MKIRLLPAVVPAALMLALSGVAAEKNIIEKSFSVKAGGKLVMKVDWGSVKVQTGTGDSVQVKVVRELRRGTDAQARDVYEQHKIDFKQNGDTVEILAERPSKSLNGWRNPFNSLHVEYAVLVPKEFNVDLRTAGGNIHVADLTGDVRVNTSGGNLNLGRINGPVDGHTSGGNITVEGGKGTAKLHTSGGDLRLRDIEGDLVAKTSGGNISVDKVRGSVRAETSGGDIKVQEAHGPVYAQTSGGNVSATLLEQPTSDCALKTSGGNVAVTLAQKVSVDVNARTSGGNIRSDFPGEMNKQRTRLAAQVNGGGPDLVLETSGGNVEIRKN